MLRKAHRLHALLHSADLLDRYLHAQLARLDLRPRQARVLDALSQVESCAQVDLARAFGVTAASMSTMTQRLVDGGFIERKVDPQERRTNTLRLTEKGRSLVEGVHAAWQRVDDRMAAAIGEDDAERLADLGFRLRDALGGRPPALAIKRRETRDGAKKRPLSPAVSKTNVPG